MQQSADIGRDAGCRCGYRHTVHGGHAVNAEHAVHIVHPVDAARTVHTMHTLHIQRMQCIHYIWCAQSVLSIQCIQHMLYHTNNHTRHIPRKRGMPQIQLEVNHVAMACTGGGGLLDETVITRRSSDSFTFTILIHHPSRSLLYLLVN